METKQQPVWAYSLGEIADVLACMIDSLVANGRADIDELNVADVVRAVGVDGDVVYIVFFGSSGSDGHFSLATMAKNHLQDAGFNGNFFNFFVNGSLVL